MFINSSGVYKHGGGRGGGEVLEHKLKSPYPPPSATGLRYGSQVRRDRGDRVYLWFSFTPKGPLIYLYPKGINQIYAPRLHLD